MKPESYWLPYKIVLAIVWLAVALLFANLATGSAMP